MSATLGAALKKIAVALLADTKVLKKAGMVLLVLLIALVMPLAALAVLFSGSVELDVNGLQQQIVANLTGGDQAMLQAIEDTMREIDTVMKEAEMPSRVKEAQALYIMALYDLSSQPGFVYRLAACFRDSPTDELLIAAVNQEFGTNISTEDFTHVADNTRSTYIDCSDYIDPTTKNNLDLAKWAVHAYESGWGYVLGTYGHVLTRSLYESKLAQYPDEIGKYADFIEANWLGKRTADCVGLIKGYSWYNVDTGEIVYGSNGMPDVGADQIYDNATEKGDISTLPEIPGLILHAKGHVGIYIGGGYAIEAMGTRYGVVKTKVENWNWTGWCKNPYITYEEETENP